MVDSIDFKKWMLRANQDIRTIENNFHDDPDFLATINCYLAQQAVEKLLKCFLLSEGQPLPKTHDLLFLVKKCSEANNKFHSLVNDLQVLNLYSIEARYPGDMLGDLTAAEAQTAYETTLKVKKLIEELLPTN